MRIVKTSLLGEINYLTSTNLPSWRYCSVKLFWSSLWETKELQLKEIVKNWNWNFYSYTVNSNINIGIKIKFAICLRITPRKISNNIELRQQIYIENRRRTGLHMRQSFTKGNPQTDCKFSRTVKICLKHVKKVKIIIKKVSIIN